MFQETATSKWQKEFSAKRIVTSCRELDQALSNGISTGVITEFCGPPGSGKTQICLQLCVNVQLPSDLDGVDGEAVFIDTNCGFSPHRFLSIATAQSTMCQQIIHRKFKRSSPSLVDKFMNGVKTYFVQEYVQLLAVINDLSDVLTENSRIRLIVIDSFSFLFRQMKYDDGDLIRTGLLYETITNLQKLADQFHCAVVLTNELTTRPADSDESPDVLVPSLGDSHLHRIGQLISLGHVGCDTFCANIDKSICSPEIGIKFRITENGIQSALSNR